MILPFNQGRSKLKQSLLLTLVFAAALYAVPLYPCPVVARPAMLDEIAQPADVGSVEVSPEFAMPLGDIAPLNNSDWEEKLPMSRDAFRFVATQCPGNGGSNFYIAGGVANSGAGNYRSYETWRYSHYSGMGTWTRLADIPKRDHRHSRGQEHFTPEGGKSPPGG
jgi:hypothetical protein